MLLRYAREQYPAVAGRLRDLIPEAKVLCKWDFARIKDKMEMSKTVPNWLGVTDLIRAKIWVKSANELDTILLKMRTDQYFDIVRVKLNIDIIVNFTYKNRIICELRIQYKKKPLFYYQARIAEEIEWCCAAKDQAKLLDNLKSIQLYYLKTQKFDPWRDMPKKLKVQSKGGKDESCDISDLNRSIYLRERD